MIISSIHHLPFLTFQEIILEGNLTLLGEGTEQQLQDVWEDILGQYAEALGEADADGYLSDRRELLFYQSQRFVVDSLCEMLSRWYTQKWADILGKIVRMKIQWTKEEGKEILFRKLESAQLRSRGIIDIHLKALEQKVADYEKEKLKEGGDDFKPTKEFFERVILNLREFSNWQFDDAKLTTFQYCELLRRYKQHIQYLESQKQKKWQE